MNCAINDLRVTYLSFSYLCINHQKIIQPKIMYFPSKWCVRTWRHWYRYTTT